MIDTDDIELGLFLEAIFQKYHYDFRGYSPASIKRRLAHAVPHMSCSTLSGLQARVLHEPTVFNALLQFLTVQVSDLFRDPPYWLALREKVMPILRTYPSLRVWIAGCSTGEEIYSMAILLREEGMLERSRIYATDINGDSLRRAEAGVYALDRVASFSESYRKSGGRASLADYYTAAYDAVTFDKSLKEHVVFSDHSLATDSVFTEVHLVSSRNVLIYFNRDLQARAVSLFAESLCRRGFLGLGAKEALKFIKGSEGFVDFSRAERIYQRH